MDIGNAIRQVRKNRGLNQEELALRAEISRKYMYSLEAGKSSPTINVLGRIAACLDLRVSDIILHAENIDRLSKDN